MNEAMGLASMNPIPGACRQGAILVHDMVDKDLKNRSWGNYRVMKDFDNNHSIMVNDEGQLDITENTDLYDKDVAVYLIKTDNVDDIFNNVLEEVSLNKQERPIHNKGYLYEIFTNHTLYTPDQLEYDPLLEKVELKKFTKALSSEIDLDRQEKKDINYSLGNPYLASGNQIEDNETITPMLSHAELDLDSLDDEIEMPTNLDLLNRMKGGN